MPRALHNEAYIGRALIEHMMCALLCHAMHLHWMHLCHTGGHRHEDGAFGVSRGIKYTLHPGTGDGMLLPQGGGESAKCPSGMSLWYLCGA